MQEFLCMRAALTARVACMYGRAVAYQFWSARFSGMKMNERNSKTRTRTHTTLARKCLMKKSLAFQSPTITLCKYTSPTIPISNAEIEFTLVFVWCSQHCASVPTTHKNKWSSRIAYVPRSHVTLAFRTFSVPFPRHLPLRGPSKCIWARARLLMCLSIWIRIVQTANTHSQRTHTERRQNRSDGKQRNEPLHRTKSKKLLLCIKVACEETV